MRSAFPLAASLSLLQRAAMPTQDDSELALPGVMLPVIEGPAQWAGYNGPSAGVTTAAEDMATSFSTGITLTRTAAQGLQQTRVLAITQGLWEVYFYLSVLTAAAHNDCSGIMSMQTPSGLVNSWIWNFYSTGAVYAAQREMRFRIPVPKDHKFCCDVSMNNAGGATTLLLNVGAIGLKLLG